MSRRPIAFNNSTKTANSIKKNKIEVGLASADYSTNPGGVTWFNGVDSTSQYVIYSDTFSLGTSTLANSKPVCWATGDFTDANVLRIINGLPTRYNQTRFTTIASALEFIAGSPIYNMVGGTLDNIVTNGLVFNVDCSQKNSYPGSGTIWYDLSGNGNDGILLNGSTFNSADSGSIVFDGVDDLMSTSYNIEAATSANLQTFCSWVYGTSTNNSFFGSGANGTGQFHIILYFQSSTQLAFGGSYYGGGSPIDQNNVVTVSPNSTWNHACIVKTAASTFDVYFNGTKVITGATKGANQPAPFYLGRWWLSQPCPSRAANVQIYNRTLTQTEITQNYNAQKSKFGL